LPLFTTACLPHSSPPNKLPPTTAIHASRFLC
jgi:hypothetical protein